MNVTSRLLLLPFLLVTLFSASHSLADEPRFMNEKILVNVPFRATVASRHVSCVDDNPKPGEFKTGTKLRAYPELLLADGSRFPVNVETLHGPISGRCSSHRALLAPGRELTAVGTKVGREIFQLTATGICIKHVSEYVYVKIDGVDFFGSKELTFEPMPLAECDVRSKR